MLFAILSLWIFQVTFCYFLTPACEDRRYFVAVIAALAVNIGLHELQIKSENSCRMSGLVVNLPRNLYLEGCCATRDIFFIQ